MAQMSEGTERTVPRHVIPNTIDSIIIIFVSESKALPNAFQRKCNEAYN